MKIALVGSGNMAWHLGGVLQRAGHQIVSVYSRTLKNAQQLSSHFNGSFATDSLAFSNSKADLIIIAVSDGAIADVVEAMTVPTSSIVVHTSGAIPLEVLSKFESSGVFYILQTLTKHKRISFSSVPICLEANNTETYKTLSHLALSISTSIKSLTSEQRKSVHLAAVFACNFTNYLYGISEAILAQKGLGLELFKPLMEETVTKALRLGTKQAQTGPAVRGDENTLNDHLMLLSAFPDWQLLYQQLSTTIKKEHGRF